MKTLKPDTSPGTSERAYRQYEDDLLRLCQAFPSGITRKVLNIKPNSWVAGLRIAARMRMDPDFRWETAVPLETVTEIFSPGLTVEINNKDRTVFVGCSTYFPSGLKAVSTAIADFNVLHREDLLNAICLLKTAELLHGEIRIESYPPTSINKLENEYPNLVFLVEPDSGYLSIL